MWLIIVNTSLSYYEKFRIKRVLWLKLIAIFLEVSRDLSITTRNNVKYYFPKYFRTACDDE